jgi:hypothetical protein
VEEAADRAWLERFGLRKARAACCGESSRRRPGTGEAREPAARKRGATSGSTLRTIGARGEEQLAEGARSSGAASGARRLAGWWWRLVLCGLPVKAVGEAAQCVGDVAQGRDGFAPDLGDNGGVDVGGGVTDFHLDELDGLFNALGTPPGGGA